MRAKKNRTFKKGNKGRQNARKKERRGKTEG